MERKPQILIVDDIPANIRMLRDVLVDDYQIFIATNGADALNMAAQKPIDLILLDIMMPDMDGYEVCRRLKADPLTQHISIIFVTARIESADEQKGLEMGAVDYITKPVNIPIVGARVKTQIELVYGRRRLEEQNQQLLRVAELKDDVELIMRHDLKGPLSSIISLPQVISAAGPLNSEQQVMIQAVEESGYQILKMVNRSLDMYKMEQGIYQARPAVINLLAILNKAIEELEALWSAKKIEVLVTINGVTAKPNDTFKVEGEELLSYSIFINLLKNAGEASPHQERVTVACSWDDMATVKISNKGVVPAQIRDTLFDKYITANKEDGTGLGVYSARLNARTQGGDVVVDTSDPAGTTLTTTFLKVF